MKTTIKLAIALAGFLFFTSCDNGTTTTTKEDADSAGGRTMGNDSMNDKMAHDDMTKMDDGLMSSMKTMMDRMGSVKISGDFDIDYANRMIEHHQGAIDMSNIEISKGSDEKMKSMAQNIIAKQTDDIAKLRQFVQTYKPSGMKHGEGTLEKMHSEMKSGIEGMQMTGNTDKDFAMMMIAHHEGGMKMSKAELTNGMSKALKDMAKKGISHETKEIAEFKAWMASN